MKSQQNRPAGSAIVVGDRGAPHAEIVGDPDIRWSRDGRLAIGVTRGARVPAPEQLWERVMTGQGRTSAESPWAGVAWDPTSRRLVAIRDPLGEVPLSWMATEARAAAGHSASFVADSAGVASVANIQRVTAFCRAQNDASDDEFIDDLHRVRPGEVVEIGPRDVSCRPFWQSPDPRDADVQPHEPRDAAATLSELLDRAIDSIDGPITLALSGGVDSALLATILSGKADVSALHITSSRHPSVDEREWAIAVARATNLPLSIVEVDQVDIWCRPPDSNPQIFPVSALDRHLRERAVGTLVTGIGADQLFSGTRAATLRQFGQAGRVRHLAQEGRLDRETLRATVAGVIGRSEAAAALSRFVKPNATDETTKFERREPWMKARAWVPGPVSERPGPLHLQWEWELVVRNSWDAGGPVAHPFLSPDLWQWAASLGPEHRFRHGREKAVVRDLLARLNPSLAGEFARRPKSQTFNAWAVERLIDSEPSAEIPRLERLAIALPATFRNRLAAFERTTRRVDADWGKFHVVALWRTLAAERWLDSLDTD